MTTELLAYQLTESIHCQRRFLDYIRTGLNELVDLQIIKKTDEKGKHYMLRTYHYISYLMYSMPVCFSVFVTGNY